MKNIFLFLIALCTHTYSSLADNWMQKADYGGFSTGFAVGFSLNGKGYVGTGSPILSAGKSFWEYDPLTNSWTQKADFAGNGRMYASAFSIGNKAYVGLGKISDSMPTDDFWEYDPNSNTWLQKANFPGGIRFNSFSFALNGRGYIGAGQGKGSWKQDFWEYDAATDIWTQKANYGGGKVGGAVAFTIDNKAYVGTGRDINLDYRKDFWQYDPISDLWIQKADFNGGERTRSIGFTLSDVGYIGLGGTLDTIFSDLWGFDPISNSWIQKSHFPEEGIPDAVGFSIGDKGYVGTGGVSGKQWWQYTPDCMPPTGHITTNIKSTAVKVSWNIVPITQTYSVRYRKTGTIPWTKTTAQLNYKKLTGLSPDMQYDWAVKSVCDAANSVSSDWSATQTFHTKPLKLEGADEEAMSFAVYPNPFSTSATISFSVQEDAAATIELFELAGRKVETLLDDYAEAGDHVIMLNAVSLGKGIYLLKMKMNDQTSVMKIVIQ
jgi:N-acetylneuraminic acid mutarotase